ncbi:hypothetical protein [Xanthomonas citri]|uniref:hypothetical protein n=1 Tax=Xanthomonas citri TaxID=346 RepID=UPI00051D22BF|nr:hypothetical protein [Xanthomonas citri]KGK63962.1 hypothetical protein NB99_22195 [Xanthomonas citri pv. fuscans]
MKNIFESEKLLAQAFKALFDFVVSMDAMEAKDEEAPAFSYMLTPKQVDDIDRVCDANQWPKITTHGIEIGVKAIQHVLTARRDKDGITDAEILEVITKAYSPRSLLRENRKYGQQSLIFNTHQKVKVGNTAFHGLAVLELKTEVIGTGAHAKVRRYLAPITCYHANEDKIRSIQRNRPK